MRNGRKRLSSPVIGFWSWVTAIRLRLRSAFGDGPWRSGKRITPCRSNFSSNVRQAMSFICPASLRQFQRRHNSRESRVRFQPGSVASQCRTKPMSSGPSRRP